MKARNLVIGCLSLVPHAHLSFFPWSAVFIWNFAAYLQYVLTRNRHTLLFICVWSSQMSFRCEIASLRHKQTPWPFQCLFMRRRNKHDIGEELCTLLKSKQITGGLPPYLLPTPCILALCSEIVILVQLIIAFLHIENFFIHYRR